jgi:hypothetical protein
VLRAVGSGRLFDLERQELRDLEVGGIGHRASSHDAMVRPDST